METSQKVFVAIGAAAIIGLAAIGGTLLFKNDQTTTAASTAGTTNTSSSTGTSPVSTATTNSTSASTASGSYKDGTYTATQSYRVPHGATNSIKVTLTISNGKISAVTTDNSYSDRESGMYVADFESSVNSSATGQSLTSYNPSRIGGASLTTDAFAAAIDTIRTQATA